MKILIIDDNPQRYQPLVAQMTGEGLDRNDFKFCICSNDARAELSKTKYDLLICDIIIPLWPDDEAKMKNSIDLIEEVIDGDLIKPKRIVGISADSQAAIDASPIFQDNVWTLIEYDETNDAWRTQLRSCIQYLLNAEAGEQPRAYNVDLAIVCALSEPELSEVLKIKWDFKPARPIDDVTFIYEGSFISGESRRSVIAASAPRMGMVASSILAHRIVQTMRPRLLIMVGICAGVKGEVSLGDVVFADSSWDWQNGKYIRDKDADPEFRAGAHYLGPSEAVRSHVSQLSKDREFLALMSANGPDNAPGISKIVIAPMASGSAVIADETIVAEIKTQSRKVAGIEMEGYGVFAAAQASDAPRPEAMVLKGVCDFADPHKNDDIQRYAAYASAHVMKELVERYFDRMAPP